MTNWIHIMGLIHGFRCLVCQQDRPGEVGAYANRETGELICGACYVPKPPKEMECKKCGGIHVGTGEGILCVMEG